MNRDIKEFKVHHENIPGRTFATYCGPFALSAALGVTAEAVRAAVNVVRGRPAHYQTRGMIHEEMSEAIESFGMDVVRAHGFRSAWVWKPEEGQPLKSLKHWRLLIGPGDRAVVNHSGHYVAYDAATDTVADTYFPRGVPFDEWKRPLRRVKYAWIFSTGSEQPETFK